MSNPNTMPPQEAGRAIAEALQQTRFLRYRKYLLPRTKPPIHAPYQSTAIRVATTKQLSASPKSGLTYSAIPDALPDPANRPVPRVVHPTAAPDARRHKSAADNSWGNGTPTNEPQTSEPQTDTSQNYAAPDRIAISRGQGVAAEPRESTVVRLADGHSIGRECMLVTRDGYQLFEFGFCFDPEYVASQLRFGRLNPNFRKYRRMGDLRERNRLPDTTYLPGCVAAINKRGAHCFYHWLTEVAPKIVALQMHGIQPDYYLVDCQSGYQQQVLRLLGVAPEQCIQPHCRLNLQADEIVGLQYCNHRVMRRFADVLKQAAGATLAPTLKTYISRRLAANRKLVNEREVVQLLSAHGFQTVTFENLSIEEQIRTVAHSQCLVTPHGSALAHCIFASPDTAVIELFPSRRANIDLYAQQNSLWGLRHTTLIGNSTKWQRNIHIDLQALERLLSHTPVTPQPLQPTPRASAIAVS